MSVAFTVSASKVVTIFKNGKQFTIDSTHPNHAKVLERVKANNFAGIENLMSVEKTINKYGKGKVTVQNGEVKYNGEAVNGYVVTRILDLLNNGLPVNPLLLFLEKLLKNPSKASVDNLYRFLESNAMPLLPDGRFIAYKKVKDNYLDIYSGKFDNSPGKTVSMPRNKVADDPNQTCSAGLHVANLDYAANRYGTDHGSRIVVVAVDPEHVVSVPTDYNNSKMRTCQYEVLEDFTGSEWSQKDCFDGWDSTDFDEEDGWDDYEDEDEDEDEDLWEDYYDDLDDEDDEEEILPVKKTSSYKPTQKRDNCGRFCKQNCKKK